MFDIFFSIITFFFRIFTAIWVLLLAGIDLWSKIKTKAKIKTKVKVKVKVKQISKNLSCDVSGNINLLSVICNKIFTMSVICNKVSRCVIYNYKLLTKGSCNIIRNINLLSEMCNKITQRETQLHISDKKVHVSERLRDKSYYFVSL